MNRRDLVLAPEVAQALREERPVVALESTVITHGLPYPDNVATARSIEAAVRAGGATPATIAVVEGRIRVGLRADEVEALGKRTGGSDTRVRKCSRRDFAVLLARRETGGTTVAGTMVVAAAAGIRIFATGGIGGVHRGSRFDISADLAELARTPVAVVCSGAKSILDLPATRELLETAGVPLLGYETDELPAFFTRRSGLPVDARIDSPAEAAAVVAAQRQLGLSGGILIGVPVPAVAELDAALAQQAIEQAQAEAEANAIHGAALTPFLLKRIVELTGGASLRANTALLERNGAVAARIASALAAC